MLGKAIIGAIAVALDRAANCSLTSGAPSSICFMQPIEDCLSLLQRALDSRRLLVFVSQSLGPLPICFFRCDPTLSPVLITETGSKISRFRVSPDAGHT